MRSINQYSPYIPDNDAIGNNIRALRKMFMVLGFESAIYRGADNGEASFSKIEKLSMQKSWAPYSWPKFENIEFWVPQTRPRPGFLQEQEKVKR